MVRIEDAIFSGLKLVKASSCTYSFFHVRIEDAIFSGLKRRGTRDTCAPRFVRIEDAIFSGLKPPPTPASANKGQVRIEDAIFSGLKLYEARCLQIWLACRSESKTRSLAD